MVFSRRAKIVSIILVILVVMATLLVIAHENSWFAPQRTYLVRLKEGYHLHRGSPVKILNTEVGKVTNMHISRVMDLPHVEVTIIVLNEYARSIRQDSVAEVVVSIPIGNQYWTSSPRFPQLSRHRSVWHHRFPGAQVYNRKIAQLHSRP